MGSQVSMNTRAEKQQHWVSDTDSCQIPRCGCGVGSVSWSCPVGRITTGTLMLAAASERDSVALNTRGTPAEDVVPQELGSIRNVGSIHGEIDFILVPCLFFALLSDGCGSDGAAG
jgi:hypothetical protein